MPPVNAAKSSGWMRPPPRASVYSHGIPRWPARADRASGRYGRMTPEHTDAERPRRRLRSRVAVVVADHGGHAQVDPAAVQVQVEIAASDDAFSERVGEGLGQGAIRPAGERPCEVAAIARRTTRHGPHGCGVRGWHRHQVAAHLLRIQLAGHGQQGPHPFVFVTMDSGG